jgi:hypothetical protein
MVGSGISALFPLVNSHFDGWFWDFGFIIEDDFSFAT